MSICRDNHYHIVEYTSKRHYMLMNSEFVTSTTMRQSWPIMLTFKIMTRGYVDYINNVNEIIKRLHYYVKKDIFKNLWNILNMIKITHFLFPLTSKKFRDNFKTETVVSSMSCNELLHFILYIKVWSPRQLWNSGENIKHRSPNS